MKMGIRSTETPSGAVILASVVIFCLAAAVITGLCAGAFLLVVKWMLG